MAATKIKPPGITVGNPSYGFRSFLTEVAALGLLEHGAKEDSRGPLLSGLLTHATNAWLDHVPSEDVTGFHWSHRPLIREVLGWFSNPPNSWPDG